MYKEMWVNMFAFLDSELVLTMEGSLHLTYIPGFCTSTPQAAANFSTMMEEDWHYTY